MMLNFGKALNRNNGASEDRTKNTSSWRANFDLTID